jgi:hypothetical protein
MNMEHEGRVFETSQKDIGKEGGSSENGNSITRFT